MSAVVVPFPKPLGARAWALSEQETRPPVLYLRQVGRFFFASPLRDDVDDIDALRSDGAAMIMKAPRIGTHPNDDNESVWRGWMVGWCTLRGFKASFVEREPLA